MKDVYLDTNAPLLIAKTQLYQDSLHNHRTVFAILANLNIIKFVSENKIKTKPKSNEINNSFIAMIIIAYIRKKNVL